MPFFSDKISVVFQKCIVRVQLKDVVFLLKIHKDKTNKQLVCNRLYDKKWMSEQCVVGPHGKLAIGERV